MEKDLVKQEAIDKIKALAKEINICMFCTDLDHHPFATRPMALREVDDAGNLWFISAASSHKNAEIREDEQVQLIFSKPSASQFLSIYGQAAVYKDQEKIKSLWSPIANAWFERGKDDPDVTVLKVNPTAAYYWDTPDGKMVTLLKLATAAITGKTMDAGEKGSLDV